ncbi:MULTISPECIES: hypothetical protein [unclassified Streptomyces]|uniref:hypothetical protein n=1 Tax=unclassified Streptomyces TaxID=2593676 RepID=UPI000AB8963D|nr:MULTISPECIES: hypothetical protein [unclassified Streptomyces]
MRAALVTGGAVSTGDGGPAAVESTGATPSATVPDAPSAPHAGPAPTTPVATRSLHSS